MRFLGIGTDGDLGDMYWRLMQAGHDVRMAIETSQFADVYEGMVPHTADWRTELPWIREAGRDGIIVFETAAHGAVQDRLRQEGFQVIGGSAFGDRLESDREFGQDQLAGFGLRIAPSYTFNDFGAAIDFVRTRPARYVYKANAAGSMRTRNYIGMADDGSDLIALLTAYGRQWAAAQERPDFVLMQHIDGVEVGVGAYFNGHEFLRPVCLDWEHKRFFAGELGELTGEMGTIVTYRGYQRIFDATLGNMAAALEASGYCGYINLNLFANEHGLWPIEFTSRFGYPGYAICEALHEEPWDSIFLKLHAGKDAEFCTQPGFSAGIVLTVPPFPYPYGYAELSKGLPIIIDGAATPAQVDALHFAEVAKRDGLLVTSGAIGYVGVATGIGESVAAARASAYDVARHVVVPNLRYRNDIGDRVINHDLERLRALGYLA